MATERGRSKRLHIRNGKLWPSTLYLGPAVVKFQTGSKGRSVTVEYKGRGKPRHKRLTGRKP